MKEDGYFSIDSRGGPGISDEWLRAAGLDPAKVAHAPAGKLFEGGFLSCSHCQKQRIAPSLTRTRPRGHCRRCNHYICDDCNAQMFLTGLCASVREKIETALERAAKFDQKYGSTNVTLALNSLKEKQP